MRGRVTYPSLATSLVALVIYLITLAPDLVWHNFGGDGGELITAAVTLGIPHPPGYPTFVLLGKLFSLLPFGTVAYRFNLFSAISIAIAAGFVTETIQLRYNKLSLQPSLASSSAAAAGGLTFAFAPLVWSQATITEVYGLNLLLLAVLLWALSGRRSAYLVGGLLGLAVTTHLTSLLMIPIILRHTSFGRWIPLALGTLLGLVPLATLPWLAHGNSPVIWGDPITPANWWWLSSGQLYRSNVMAVSLPELSARLGPWTGSLLSQLTWAAPPLIAFELWSGRSSSRTPERWWILTALLYLVYAVGYDSDDAIIFVLPALLLLAAAIGHGLRQIGTIALLLPLFSLLLNFSQMDLSRELGMRPLAEDILQAAPKDAILVTPGNNTIFALWYFQHVEQQRTDLILVDANLFAFDWYRQRLQSQYPFLISLEHDDLAGFEQQNQRLRQFCHVSINGFAGRFATEQDCLPEMPI